jgi:hypothetical protein
LQVEELENRICLASSLSINNVTVLGPSLGTAIAGTLSPGQETAAYQFTGVQGQRLGFTWLSGQGSGTWAVYGAGNAVVGASQNFGSNLLVTLPTGGSYTLLLSGNQTAPLAYSFQVQNVSDAPVPVSGFDTLHSGTLAVGASVTFNYTAPAGRLVYLDNRADNYILESFTLTGPDGATVVSGPYSAAYLLPRSGNYTLTIKNNYLPVAIPYDFRLLDLDGPAVSTLPLGQTVNGSVAAGATDFYRFQGAVGQRLYFNGLSNNSGQVQIRLYGPDGSQQSLSGNSDANAGPVTLTQAGTYYLSAMND